METPLLTFSHLSFGYRGKRPLFEGLDWGIARGSITAVIGANGSGKSTLLRLACGMLRPTAGRVMLEGRDLFRLPDRARARRIAVLPQLTCRELPYRVRELVLLGRLPHRSLLERFNAEDRAAVDRALADLDLADRGDDLFPALSSGEKQRVLLAAALAQEPVLLLLDEPTSALDLGHKLRLMEHLRQLRRQRDLTVLLVSHDLELTARAADALLLLKSGRVLAAGRPAEVVTTDRIREAFGCPVTVAPAPDGGPIVLPPSENGGGEGGRGGFPQGGEKKS